MLFGLASQRATLLCIFNKKLHIKLDGYKLKTYQPRSRGFLLCHRQLQLNLGEPLLSVVTALGERVLLRLQHFERPLRIVFYIFFNYLHES